jgi:hypothetical protein
MLGEPGNQFSLTRAALSTRGAQKQIPISIGSWIGPGPVSLKTEPPRLRRAASIRP